MKEVIRIISDDKRAFKTHDPSKGDVQDGNYLYPKVVAGPAIIPQSENDLIRSRCEIE